MSFRPRKAMASGLTSRSNGPAHEDDVVDFTELDAGVLDDVVEGDLGALEQVGGHLLEVGAGELLIEVDGAGLAHGQVLQVNIRGGRRGQLLLGLPFSSLFHRSEIETVLAMI